MQKIQQQLSIDGIKRIHVRQKPTRTSKARMFLQPSVKIASVLLMAVAVVSGFSSVGPTFSYFNDTERVLDNRLQAGVLFLQIISDDEIANRVASFAQKFDDATSTEETASTTEPIVEPEDINVGTESFDVTVGPNDESLPLVFAANGELSANNPPGCEALEIEASNGDEDFEGLLKDFISPETNEVSSWHFLVRVPMDNASLSANVICRGSIVFKAHGEEGTAFSDEKRFSFALKTWNIPEPESSPEPEGSPAPTEPGNTPPSEPAPTEEPTEPVVEPETSSEPEPEAPASEPETQEAVPEPAPAE